MSADMDSVIAFLNIRKTESSSELWVYVALDASVKFTVLKVRNDSGRSRRLSATGYVEWVLGDLRPKSVMHVVTEVDPPTGALFARNPYKTDSPDGSPSSTWMKGLAAISGDRTEFLGRNGTLQNPAAMAPLTAIREDGRCLGSLRGHPSSLRAGPRARA